MIARRDLETRAWTVATELAAEGIVVKHVILCPFHKPEGPLATVAEDHNGDILCIHDLPVCKEYEAKDIPDYLNAVTTRLKS